MMPISTGRNIAILCNRLAGSGRAVLLANTIEKSLVEKNITATLYAENWPGDFNGFSDIFIVGGDGTLNYFINHYPTVDLPLVIFNGGTGNDFHWLLYADLSLEEQLHLAMNEAAKPIDIGKCNQHYFINGVGIGFEGEVARALSGSKKLAGKTSFLITILKKIFTYRSKFYEVRSAGQIITGKKLLVDISNGKRAGGGFHIAPAAKADDGFFDLVIADKLNSLQRLRYLPVIEKGNHLHLPFIHHSCTTKVIIESDQPLQYHLDGEYYEDKSLIIEILPGKLKFRF